MTLSPWAFRCTVFLAVAVLGAIAAIGQEPYRAPVLLLCSFAICFRLYQRARTVRQATFLGWVFGTGYFCHALQWIVSPFLVDAATHGWMAPFALMFLGAGLALFWAIAFGCARWLSRNDTWPLVVTLAGAELIRAYIFTGFPWAMPAQALVGSILAHGLAFVGPYGMNVAIFACAALIGRPYTNVADKRVAIGAAAAFAFLAFTTPFFRSPVLTDHIVRLVQPNAAQRDKWNPDLIPVFFDRQLAYTAAAPTAGQNPPDLVIWSETAIPWPLDLAAPALDQISNAAGGVPVALGVQRRTSTDFYNSMVVLGQGGAVTNLYDKHHLVPFGEYMPFGETLARLGIFGLAVQSAGGYTAGEGAALLDLGPLGPALPLICYEAVFAHDVNAAPNRPAFMIQVTNDAWFGKGAGPRQHLAQARMRAIEQGLPLARAANTGISAMIDPYGRVIAALPLNEAGFIDAPLPAPLAPTLYSRTGDLPLSVVLLLGCGFGVIRRSKV